MMSGQTVVGFRDSAYLYYPLFKWIDAQWASGQIPLWNPYCNFGMPVVGDGTSSVFYPGKLVFFCRFLSYPARYGIYLAIHIPIAGAGAYWCARKLRANRGGAALAGFSYAFGGSVLFSVTNVIYLVSAAWLPFALGAVWLMVRTGHWRWSVAAGVCCALMILGGDPQMVYHVGLIASATIVGEFFRRRRRRRKNVDRSKVGAYRWAIGATCKLVLMVAVTSILALAQILPTYEWSQQSERTNPNSAVNVYGLFGELVESEQEEADRQQAEGKVFSMISQSAGRGSGILDVLKGDPDAFSNRLDGVRQTLLGEPGGTASSISIAQLTVSVSSATRSGPVVTVQDHAYQFSQPPWTIAELFWPNASGKMFPIHQRWTDGLPGADRVWVPSLYAGLLTVLIAMGGMRIWGRRRKHVWLTRVALFFGIASFGWYGAVWTINEFLPINRQMTELGPQVGGFYWMLTMLLPKYYAFRYPAKLFVIASLALSLLAGIQLRDFRSLINGKIAILVSVATVVGFLFMLFGMNEEFFQRIPASALFGPFDVEGSRAGIMFGLVQALIVLCVTLLAIRFYAARKRGSFALGFILIITAIDLSMANQWMLSETSVSGISGKTKCLEELESQLKHEAIRVGPLSVFRSRDGNEPPDWASSSSPNRLKQVILWQRETLFPKQHLEQDGLRLIGSFTSIWPEKYEILLLEMGSEQFDYHRRQPFKGRWMAGAKKNSLQQFRSKLFEPCCDAEFIFSDSPKKYEAKLNPIESQSQFVFLSAQLETPNAELTYINGFNRNEPPKADHSPSWNCELVEFKSNRFQVLAETEQKRWLMHNSIYDGNWFARIRNVTTGVEVVKQMKQFGSYHQGVLLDPGEFEIEIFYQPILCWIGALVSGIGWSVLLLGWQVARLRKLKKMTRPARGN